MSMKLKEGRKIFSITKGLYAMEIVIPYIKKEYTANHGRIKMEEIAKVFNVNEFNCLFNSPATMLDDSIGDSPIFSPSLFYLLSRPEMNKDFDILISEVVGRANNRSSVKIDTWLPMHRGSTLSRSEERWLTWIADRAAKVFDYDAVNKERYIEVKLSDGTRFNYEI